MTKLHVFMTCLVAAHIPSITLGFISQGDEDHAQPIEILADEGITCDDQQGQCTARGNVRAKRGDYTLTASLLRAHFSKDASGEQQITRLEAEGRVHIMSTHPGSHRHAWAERALYEDQDETLTLFGASSRVENEGMIITAKERIDYSSVKLKAEAKGEATATREGRVIQADHLIATFQKGTNDKIVLDHVEGHGQVVLTTPEEIATGDRGFYHATQERAELHGNVRITNCDGQLEGASAEVNLKDHTSRLIEPDPSVSSLTLGAQPKRVRALLLPRPKKDKDVS
ncbi:MAG: LptA/OstA family protein [Holosporales bacterium]